MPHTVRDTDWTNNPATKAANTSNVGAVKHGRKVTSTRDSAPGKVTPRSIGGTLFRLRQSCYQQPPMLHPPPAKINKARRAQVNFHHHPAATLSPDSHQSGRGRDRPYGRP